jgi:AcrR family transcriptional regulator
VGVAPTAFYRHFRSTADLGVALVEEVLGSLHPVLGDLMSAVGDSDELIERAVDLIARHVDAYPAHVRFIARERHSGVQPVRDAIQGQLARFAEEVRGELAKRPETDGWTDDDRLMLAGLYVDQMLVTASLFLAVLDAPEEERVRVTRLASRRMRLISIGCRHWLD